MISRILIRIKIKYPPTAVYSSPKNKNTAFGEHENSNFGTEWMSDNK